MDANQPAADGGDRDDTIEMSGELIKSIDGQPARLMLMKWRKILLPLLGISIKALFTLIPMAILVTLLIGFFVGVVVDADFDFWAVLRWSYIGIFGVVNLLTTVLVLLFILWRAIAQRTPFRLMYEALVIHNLHVGNKAAFKQYRRAELENLVALRRAGGELLAAMQGALLAGLLTGRRRR